jgi:hypothetical protein
VFLLFLRGIGIPLRKGILIPAEITILRNRSLPNKKMAIRPFLGLIPQTKWGLSLNI